jgi:hypothetical protein
MGHGYWAASAARCEYSYCVPVFTHNLKYRIFLDKFQNSLYNDGGSPELLWFTKSHQFKRTYIFIRCWFDDRRRGSFLILNVEF